MIPTWKESIENALENLKSGRSVYIVDFYDQKDLPVWFRKILQSWLKQFHVKYPEKLIPFLKELEKKRFGKSDRLNPFSKVIHLSPNSRNLKFISS